VKFLGVEPDEACAPATTTNFKSNGSENGGMGERKQRFEANRLQVHTPARAFDSQPVSQNLLRLTSSYCRLRASRALCAKIFLKPLKIKDKFKFATLF
jgi:hypothetical protein